MREKRLRLPRRGQRASRSARALCRNSDMGREAWRAVEILGRRRASMRAGTGWKRLARRQRCCTLEALTGATPPPRVRAHRQSTRG
ncbi:hypothetical protein T484DRAFT_1937600 [Baffinella frigidus]|nr:hypothetical protein T484DRAFT_1937600 [Cryptophyta sp. CCMP2293]